MNERAHVTVESRQIGAILVEEARALGFHKVGLVPVPAAQGGWPRHPDYRRWLDAGHAGEMRYLEADAERRRDPRALFPEARTVVMVALNYGSRDLVPADRLLRGRIARYARGEDYHLVLKRRLTQLADRAGIRVAAVTAKPLGFVVCVDTAPLLEREAAAAAGLGFIAKSTMLIAPGLGSYLLLGALLVDVAATHEGSIPVETSRCGRCRACLDACPTGAILPDHTVDARRCIAYLTIEQPGPIPLEFRRAIGDRIFGCDVCQEVCPFNQTAAAEAQDPELAATEDLPISRSRPELVALLGIGAAQFRRFVKRSPLRRIHRPQLLRNVAVALGNLGGEAEVPALIAALAEPSPLVRAHVAWALGEIARRHGSPAARAALAARITVEEDPDVRAEILSTIKV